MQIVIDHRCPGAHDFRSKVYVDEYFELFEFFSNFAWWRQCERTKESLQFLQPALRSFAVNLDSNVEDLTVMQDNVCQHIVLIVKR